MKSFFILCVALFLPVTICVAEHPDNIFYTDLQKIQAKYRASKAELIRKADKVVLYIVEFDVFNKVNDDPFENDEDDDDELLIAPYESTTKTRSSKVIVGEDRKKLLNVLADQIAKPQQGGGALCHFPIHGIRIYKDGELLHEGTFCWVCENFGFSYPIGAGWLDTNAELNKLFTKLLPIPQKELDRFKKKHPDLKP